MVLDPRFYTNKVQRAPNAKWLSKLYLSLSERLPRASAVPKCGVSGAFIPSSCEFTVTIASVFDDGERLTPHSDY